VWAEDVDRDGDVDVLAAGMGLGPVYWYEHDCATAPPSAAPSASWAPTASPTPRPTLFCAENGFSKRVVADTDDGSGYYDVVAVDFDGDGDAGPGAGSRRLRRRFLDARRGGFKIMSSARVEGARRRWTSRARSSRAARCSGTRTTARSRVQINPRDVSKCSISGPLGLGLGRDDVSRGLSSRKRRRKEPP